MQPTANETPIELEKRLKSFCAIKPRIGSHKRMVANPGESNNGA
jgi:hypothetical protein